MTATSSTRFVDSADGTAIAYDVNGTGPAVVVVEGAVPARDGHRPGSRPAAVRALHVFATTDAAGARAVQARRPTPCTLEVEDLVAVLEAAGPDAFVIGASSGAVLVLEALRAGVWVRMVALYEAPFIVDNTHAPNDANLGAQTQQLIAARPPGCT